MPMIQTWESQSPDLSLLGSELINPQTLENRTKYLTRDVRLRGLHFTRLSMFGNLNWVRPQALMQEQHDYDGWGLVIVEESNKKKSVTGIMLLMHVSFLRLLPNPLPVGCSCYSICHVEL